MLAGQFANKTNENETKRKTFAFSGGRHRCPGEKLAKSMVNKHYNDIQFYLFYFFQKKVKISLKKFANLNLHLQYEKSVPKLCFRRATLAQRQEKWFVKLKISKDETHILKKIN